MMQFGQATNGKWYVIRNERPIDGPHEDMKVARNRALELRRRGEQVRQRARRIVVGEATEPPLPRFSPTMRAGDVVEVVVAPPHPDPSTQRYVEVLRDGEWVRDTMRALRRGDVYRLFEHDGEAVDDGRICIAMVDAVIEEDGRAAVRIMEPDPLAGSIADLRRLLGEWDYDDLLDALEQAELAGANRKGALAAIRERRASLADGEVSRAG